MPNAIKIMVIRHAEKPADSGLPYGVLATGEQNTESLVVQGWERAGALACFFAPTNGILQNSDLAKPQFLCASGIGKHSNSLRPQQTIMPLGKKLGLPVNTDYLKGQEVGLVKKALACDGVVLICWEHHHIPTIANQILDDSTTAPQSWPDERFDLVWVFDFNSTLGKYSFTQVTQCLLAGDLSAIIQ